MKGWFNFSKSTQVWQADLTHPWHTNTFPSDLSVSPVITNISSFLPYQLDQPAEAGSHTHTDSLRERCIFEICGQRAPFAGHAIFCSPVLSCSRGCSGSSGGRAARPLSVQVRPAIISVCLSPIYLPTKVPRTDTFMPPINFLRNAAAQRRLWVRDEGIERD